MPLARLFGSIALLLVSISPGIAMPTLEALQKPPLTLEQIWETVDAVVYGTAVRIQIDATNGYSETYDSTFRVERCWKGDLEGDVRIEGGYNSGCYISPPFRIRESYLVLLRKLRGRNAYEPWDILVFRLSPDGTPLPEQTSSSTNPFALFGGYSDRDQHRYNERALSIFELAERMAGHEESAKRAHELRTGPKQEKERIKREKEAADFLASAQAEFQRAQDTERLADRKTRLLSLQTRLVNHHGKDINEIKETITAELSVVETLLSNGIQVRRKIAP